MPLIYCYFLSQCNIPTNLPSWRYAPDDTPNEKDCGNISWSSIGGNGGGGGGCLWTGGCTGGWCGGCRGGGTP